MRIRLLTLFLYAVSAGAQDTGVSNWLNQNAVAITDMGQETPLTGFDEKHVNLFNKVSVFGFGEATHYNKEFFDLKAKFFKYLAENHGVTVFMMEESYSSGERVNNYLAGGSGDAQNIAMQMGFAIWRNKEVADLIQWMRNFNQGKPADKQLRFYGIDDQFGRHTNEVVKEFISKYKIVTKEGTNQVLDSAAKIQFYNYDKKKVQAYAISIDTIRQEIATKFVPAATVEKKELDEALHALTVLKQYLYFVLKPSTTLRDTDMAANVAWIMNHEGAGSKGFIWAHNSHIDVDKDETPLGYLLKQRLGDSYYSVGFEFAKGEVYIRTRSGKKGIQGSLYTITEPFENSYAAVLNKTQYNNYFFDINSALRDQAMPKFLHSKNRSRYGGGGGFYTKSVGEKMRIADVYDAIIFVREVSHATYFEEVLPEIMRVK